MQINNVLYVHFQIPFNKLFMCNDAQSFNEEECTFAATVYFL